jgi:hypothetical protein
MTIGRADRPGGKGGVQEPSTRCSGAVKGLRIGWRQGSLYERLAFLFSLIGLISVVAQTLLMAFVLDSWTQVSITSAVQDMLLVAGLLFLLMVTHAKYQLLRLEVRAWQRKCQSLGTTFGKYALEISLHWHRTSHFMRDTVCRFSGEPLRMSARDVQGSLSSLCDHAVDVLSCHFGYHYIFHAALVSPIGKEHVVVVGRSRRSRSGMEDTAGVHIDCSKIQIGGKTPLMAVVTKSREGNVWAHDYVSRDGSFDGFFVAPEGSHDCLATLPVRCEMEDSCRSVRYELAGFLILYTDVAGPQAKGVFCQPQNTLNKTVENYMAALADEAFILIKKGTRGRMPDMIPLSDSDYAVDASNLQFVRTLNSEFVRQYHGPFCPQLEVEKAMATPA